ncbi:hypothetical protein CEP54_014430 [Fusarium duplospermum]|uniref:C2H2-type domain-containing protein n=1 Tax=Fusarium duplospermum TaxID=1325734 RepID=A0A428NW33_9HYPO|nr:hypothetical protein CEP54_014430 [Fusarium duplospermum]
MQTFCNRNAEKEYGEPGRTPLVVVFWMAHHFCSKLQALKISMPNASQEEIAFHILDRWGFPIVPWIRHAFKGSLCKGPDHGIAMLFGLVPGKERDPVQYIDLQRCTITIDAVSTNFAMQNYSTDSWETILHVIRAIPFHHVWWRPDPQLGSRPWSGEWDDSILPKPPNQVFYVPLAPIVNWVSIGQQKPSQAVFCDRCNQWFPQVGAFVEHCRSGHQHLLDVIHPQQAQIDNEYWN